MKTKCVYVVSLAAALVVLTGCVTDDQLGPVRSFSTAATEFSTQADGALTQLKSSYVDRNIAKVASGDGVLTEATFVGELDSDAGFKASQSALKSVAAYAGALNALATASYTSAVDSAATSLYGSLQAVDKDAHALIPGVPSISQTDFGYVADAVKGLGEAIADEKRLKAIKVAVHTADPGIQAICKGFASTLKGVGDTYKKNLDRIYTAAFIAYQQNPAKLSFDEQVAKMNQLLALKVASDNAQAMDDKLAEAATALAKSHAEIEKALQSDKLDWASVVREVGQLKSLADDVKTFNSSLKKSSP